MRVRTYARRLAGVFLGAEMDKKRIGLAVVALLASGTAAGWRPVESLSPYDILPGQWGWSSADCERMPAKISFAKSGKRMHVRHPTELEGPVELKLTSYTVTGRKGNALAMRMDGEDCRDDAGRLVAWDAVVLDHDTYCWRRSDWRPENCTKPLRRCPAGR